MRFAVTTMSLLAMFLLAAPAGAQEHADHHHGTRTDATGAAAHPEPRPGLSERVLPEREFSRDRHQRVYSMARAIPHVLDGLYCHCRCHDPERGRRSLLSCYQDGMFTGCGICQGQARLAYRLHEAGRTLDQIRAAVDAEYGS